MERTTQEQKNKIILLKEEGKKDAEIARELNLSTSKVNYWANSKVRENHILSARKYFLKKSPEEKREYYRSRNEYLKAYSKKRYKEDPIFRKKQIERVKKSKKKKQRENKNGR